MKYLEHMRKVCTEDAANGTFIQGPGANIMARHHMQLASILSWILET